MRRQNNLGRQYTDAPNFGKTYPQTQYKGYAEEEGSPYGGANANRTSNMHHSQPGTQYGYTNQYQGHNPQHSEARFDQNNQPYAGGAAQYRPNMQSQPMNQPQGRSGMSQLQYQNANTAYPVDRYQGLSQYQSGTVQAQDLGRYESGASGMATHYPGSGAQYPNQPQMAGIGGHDQLEQSGQIQTATYNDRDRVNDLLASEKYLTEGYNVSTFEATNPQLQDTLNNILNETHRNRENLYQIMEQRGWYKSEQADQQQISQAYNKFSQYKNQLPY